MRSFLTRRPPGSSFQLASLLVLLGAASPLAARADVTMNVSYYTLGNADGDVNGSIYGAINNEVRPTLGPNGLPVLNVAANGCTSNCYGGPTVHDVNAAGELTYWSLTNPNLALTGTGTVALPYGNGSLFPPNGTGSGNSDGFQTAVFSTTLDVPATETIDFTVGADDDAFVYLDGSIVCSLGGIHNNQSTACTSATMAAGDHSLEVFYADLHTTEASMNFAIDTAGVTSVTSGVTPEPPSLLLFASALLAAGAMRLRQRLAA